MSNSEIDLFLEYKKQVDIENDNGVPYLSQLMHSGETRLTQSTSEFLHQFIVDLVKNLEIAQIFHFCSGDIGFFNCIKSSIMWHFVNVVFDNVEIEKKNAFDKALYLVELLPNPFNYNLFSHDLESVLEKAQSNDYILLVTDLNQGISTGFNSIQSICKKKDFYVHAVFNFTKNLGEYVLLEGLEIFNMEYFSGFNLIMISGENSAAEYYHSSNITNASIDVLRVYFENKNSTPKKVYTNIKSGLENIDLTKGAWIDRGQVSVIGDIKKNNDLHGYFNQYCDYKKYKLRDLVQSNPCFLDLTEDSVDDLNTIYFSVSQKSSHSKLLEINVSKILSEHTVSLLKGKIKIRLDDDKVSFEYIHELFFSNFGRCLIGTIPNFSEFSEIIEPLLDLEIPLPKLEKQHSIVAEIRNYEKVRECLERFGDISTDSVFDPKFSDENAKRIRKILSAFEELSDVDKLRQLITDGESKTVEFKQTLVLDVRKETKEKYIEDVAIKTVAAFLNSDGGFLLIGVDDDRNIVGINGEIEKFFSNEDKYLLHFKSLFTSRIGAEYYPFINQRIVSLEGRKVFFIECERSDKEVYVDGKDFFVRTNPATDKLEGPRLVNYVKARFK